jgi:hypothetical protein
MKELIGYQWGLNNLTYFYVDGSNETFVQSLPQFNNAGYVPPEFWSYVALFVLLYIVGMFLVLRYIGTAKRIVKMPKKRS